MSEEVTGQVASHTSVRWALDWWWLKLYDSTTERFEDWGFFVSTGQEAGWVSKEVRLCTMFVMDTLH